MRVLDITGENPAQVRRELQTRYDSYMRGERRILGTVVGGPDFDKVGETPEQRSEFYERTVEFWPRKSRKLMRSVLKETLFTAQSIRNHRNGVEKALQPLVDEDVRTAVEISSVYISGMGRNACLLSTISLDKDRPPQLSSPLILRPELAFSAISRMEDISLLIDPDYGLGMVKGPTPEVFDDHGGCEDLALQSVGQLVPFLSRGYEIGSVSLATSFQTISNSNDLL